LARRFRYLLQIDVAQFFPAIDHQILRTILARKIGDPQVMWLVDQILASGTTTGFGSWSPTSLC
jgi:hypothetical protein